MRQAPLLVLDRVDVARINPPPVETRPPFLTRPKPVTRPQMTQSLPIQPESRLQSAPVHLEPHAPGFLPADEWGYIQKFHTELDMIGMEECSRFRERCLIWV